MRLIIFLLLFIPYLSFCQIYSHNPDIKYKELLTYKRNSLNTEWKLYYKDKVENDSIQKKKTFYTLKYHLFNDDIDTIAVKSIMTIDDKIIEEYHNFESKYKYKMVKSYEKKRLTNSEHFKWSDSLNTWQSNGFSNYKYCFSKDSMVQVQMMTGIRINSTETKVYYNGKLTEFIYKSVYNDHLKNGDKYSILSKHKIDYWYDAQGREIKALKVDKKSRKDKDHAYKFKNVIVYVDSSKKINIFYEKKFMKRWTKSRFDTTYYYNDRNETITVYYSKLIKGQDKLYLSRKTISKYDKQKNLIEEIKYSANNQTENMITVITDEKQYKGLFLVEKTEYKY